MGILSDIGDAIGRGVTGPGGSRRDSHGNQRGASGLMKPIKKKTTAGTTGDPDNPTLDELREGVYDLPEADPGRYTEPGRRRRRTLLTDGEPGRYVAPTKTLLGS